MRRKGFRPVGEYEPAQRGAASAFGDLGKIRGTRQWKDGEQTDVECAECGCCLRVRRAASDPWPMLWCPCGYEQPAVE